MWEIAVVEGQDRPSPITPGAIRHLPSTRQRRYVRLAILDVLRKSERDLEALEVQDRTGFDARTVRDELARLTATREVERITRRGPDTFRLIGQPTRPFSKHLLKLNFGAYSIEHVRTPNGAEALVVQERAESRDGTYDPVGGILIRKEDLDSFIRALEQKAEEALDFRRSQSKV